jgi:hypothetical protein
MYGVSIEVGTSFTVTWLEFGTMWRDLPAFTGETGENEGESVGLAGNTQTSNRVPPE